MSKTFILLFCIVVFGAIVRLLWINSIPHSVNSDELYYLLSAKSFAVTGKDVTQTVSPLDILMFRYPPGDFVQAELSYFLDILTVGWFPFSLLGNALPNALLSVGLIFIIYLVARKLLSQEIAIVAAFVTAINPWLISIGRTSYEMIPATFFYLLAFYILLIAKGWRILLVLPIFIFAFYSYIATKLIFLPLVFIFIAYSYLYINKRRYLKTYLTVLVLTTVFVIFYAFQLFSSPSTSRLSEVLLPNSPIIAEQVDSIRKVSIHASPTPLFINKITHFVHILISNAFNVFSFDYLFVHGDYFSFLGQHGLFYSIDSIFLFAGIAWVFLHRKKIFALFVLIILLGIIPQIIHDVETGGNFTPHIVLIIPFFIIFIAAGIWIFLKSIKGKYFYLLATVTIVIYIFSVGNFVNFYFFRLPLQHNFFNFSHRLLDKYIMLSELNEQKVYVYTPFQKIRFKEYVFYNNKFNKNNVPQIAKSIHSHNPSINHVTFLGCDRGLENLKGKSIVIVETECGMDISREGLTIPQLSDSGGVYKIFNDKICNKYQLKRFIYDFNISDFDLDNMSAQKFCQTFITSI